MKNKLKDLNEDNQLLALDVLDYLMVQGKMPMTTQIASNDFLNNLISILKNRNSPVLSTKILYLIKKWATRFDSQKDIIPNFSDKFNFLKKAGIIFPDNCESSYFKYTGEGNYDDYKSDFKTYEDVQPHEYNFPSTTVVVDLEPRNYDKKYQQFVKELVTLIDTIVLANVNFLIFRK
jgi:hypothetical protein